MRRVLVLLLTFVCFSSVTQFAQVSGQTFRPVVRGRRGVVAGGHPLAVEAGMRILQHGGNAVDAGVATILAGSVIEFSHFSFGGEVPILIKLKGKPVAVVEGMGQAPMKATLEFFINRTKQETAGMATMAGARSGVIPSTGPLPATVPAVLDACVTALAEFGTKSLGEVKIGRASCREKVLFSRVGGVCT